MALPWSHCGNLGKQLTLMNRKTFSGDQRQQLDFHEDRLQFRDRDFYSFLTDTNLLYLNPILLSSLIYCLFKTATGALACLKGAL